MKEPIGALGSVFDFLLMRSATIRRREGLHEAQGDASSGLATTIPRRTIAVRSATIRRREERHEA